MMIAAYRISVANGWNIKTLLPSTGNHKQIKGEEAYDDDKLSKEEERNSETDTTVSATTVEALGTGGGEGSTWSSVEAELILAVKLTLIVGLLSYATKYGEPFLNFPFHPDLKVALAMVGIPTCINMAQWANVEDDDGDDGVVEAPETSTSVPLL